ncbi:CsgG/HfaB family protein [Anaeromyxobacter dehalogenans]|uniref:Curli production assembly/transport component CsgG n=1 Tax=Anaeromyxobacter dehalogenans (strain 2CP-C) TaxID=290397 RepID=Q2IMY7_ANADE|nr:CsgG/HfaB family protein [Anaeromyxobacter dehalogenans]ABC80167.1 Curli production assembly/transport component CsgG [Anaeromyxobacter dehalogenans 2CP-C]
MRIRFALPAAAALVLQACATVSQPPVEVESPVPKAAQVAAQQQAAAPSAKRYKTKIAIARFTNETSYGRSLLNDADLDRIGKQASDMLASRLVMSGAFVVLERPDLQKLEREQAISGGAGLVGADTVISGSVTEFGRSVGGKKGFLSSTKVQTARAKVDVRLVDVKTGHAYFSALGAGEASTESGEIAGFGSRAEYDATLNDRAIAAAISDVIDRLVATLAARPWRSDILEVQGRQVFISGGRHQGVREGDLLAVMEAGNKVKSRQTGFEVALPPKRVGTLKVLSLFGDGETSEGAVCELTSGTIEKASLPKLFVAEATP